MAGRGAARSDIDGFDHGRRRRRRGAPVQQFRDVRARQRADVLVDTEFAVGDLRVRVQVIDAGGEIAADGIDGGFPQGWNHHGEDEEG